MTTVASLVDDFGDGLLHKRQLVRHGAHDHHLTWAVRHGQVRRPRRGWYTTFPRDDPRFIAVKVGGRLTGASALALLGAWTRHRSPAITVSVPKNASRLRRVKGARVVWDDGPIRDRGSQWAVDARDALGEALLEVNFEEAVALVDWALHSRLITMDEVSEITDALPLDARRIADWVDPRCESFLESIVRTRLRQAGFRLVSQKRVNGSQRIDLVVDDVVGLELDGFAYHATSFEADRRKDIEIAIEGRVPLRVSFDMVFGHWSRVLLAIRAAVAMHRRGAVRRFDNSGRAAVLPGHGTRFWLLPRRTRSSEPELPKRNRKRQRRGRVRRANPAIRPRSADRYDQL
jgi:very-short-patch-repair endonuclease